MKQAKTNRVLPRKCTGHNKHPLPTTQEKTLHMDFDYILCSQRWRSSIQSTKTRPGADCGSDHEHLITKFRLKLKKVGKTTKPFRYDLNQIPSDYTVEVRNRFKGLDLIDWRRQWHPTPVLLPGKSHGRRSLVGCSPWGREELDMTERLHSYL